MKKILHIILHVCLFSYMIGCGPNYILHEPKAETQSEEIRWLSYSDNLLSSSETKPFLLYFGSKICEPCQEMEETTFQNSETIYRINNNFIPIKIYESDDEKMDNLLFEEYSLNSIPAVIVIASDKKRTSLVRVFGYTNSKQLNYFLKMAILMNRMVEAEEELDRLLQEQLAAD